MTLFEITITGVVLTLFIGSVFAFIKKLLLRRSGQETESSLQLLQLEMKNLRDQIQTSIEGLRGEVDARLHQLNDNVSKRLVENAQAVQSSGGYVASTVGQRMAENSQVLGEIGERLGKMDEATGQILHVGKNIAGLQDLLRAPQFRGGLGEYLLGELLSQMFPKNHFETQYTFESGERVDAVLYVGEGRIPIDSKFPMESFSKAVEAKRFGSEDEAQQAQRRFRKDIKKHVDDIASKYIRPTENFYEFALMYIPAENVYYEAIIRDEAKSNEKGLFEYATSRRVIPVSPNTLFAYFQVILMGLRGLKVEEDAKKILSGLGQLQKELGKIQDSFDKVGPQLQHARTNYDEAHRRLMDFSGQLTQLSELSGIGGSQLILPSNEEED